MKLPLLLQAAGVLHGFVGAAPSAEPVPYAVVEIVQTEHSTSADERGWYALAGVPPGSWTVRVNAPGYHSLERVVEFTGGTVRLDLLLERAPIELAAISVGADTLTIPAAGPAPVRLSAATIQAIPAVAEPDVFRALDILPSVSTISDFSTALFVRGGTPDQTLVQLDGAPLFNPYHLGGMYAAIDPGAVASVDVTPGAVPASLDGRLGGVVQIWTRSGGRDRVRGSGGIGLVSSRATLDGPINDARGSFLASARLTYIDLVTTAASGVGLIESPLPYGFQDGHLKLTHDIAGGGQASLSLYATREVLRSPDDAIDADYDWGARVGSVEFRQPFRGNWMARALVAYSGFDSDAHFGDRRDAVEGAVVDADMSAASLEASIERRGNRHVTSIGAKYERYRFGYDVWRNDESFFAELLPNLEQSDGLALTSGFIEHRWLPTDVFSIHGGVRVLHADEAGAALLPRLGARLSLSDRLEIFAGAGMYAQALRSLRNEESEAASLLAYDLLLPRHDRLARGQDVAAGASWRGDHLVIRADAYWKSAEDIAVPPIPRVPSDAPALAIDASFDATSRTTGLELMGQYHAGGKSLMVNYALIDVTYEVDGVRYTPRFDRTHTIDITGVIPLGETVELATRFVGATGQPYSPVVGVMDGLVFNPRDDRFAGDYRDVFIYGAPNSRRLAGYWRLDAGLRGSYEKDWFGRQITLEPYFEITNLLGQRNTLFMTPDPYDGGLETYSPQLPLLPTFGVSWRF